MGRRDNTHDRKMVNVKAKTEVDFKKFEFRVFMNKAEVKVNGKAKALLSSITCLSSSWIFSYLFSFLGGWELGKFEVATISQI
jgi:hypothetical protein